MDGNPATAAHAEFVPAFAVAVPAAGGKGTLEFDTPGLDPDGAARTGAAGTTVRGTAVGRDFDVFLEEEFAGIVGKEFNGTPTGTTRTGFDNVATGSTVSTPTAGTAQETRQGGVPVGLGDIVIVLAANAGTCIGTTGTPIFLPRPPPMPLPVGRALLEAAPSPPPTTPLPIHRSRIHRNPCRRRQ